MSDLYDDATVNAVINAQTNREVCEHERAAEPTREVPAWICEDCDARAILDAVSPLIARRAAAHTLRSAASDPNARLSGHGGVGVRWLRSMADEIERWPS